MKKLSFAMLLALCVFAVSCSEEENDINVHSRYSLSLPDYAKADTMDLGSEENLVHSWDDKYGKYEKHKLTDVSGHFEFDCIRSFYYEMSSSWGMASPSFAFTNADNLPNYDYSSVPSTGKFKKSYVVVGALDARSMKPEDTTPSVCFKASKDAKDSKAYQVEGMYVTNCKYAYTSMTVGTPYGISQNIDEIFKEGDVFTVTVTNLERTKEVKFNLAEGIAIHKDWFWVDLSELGVTEGLTFSTYSTKHNEFGNITPNYFCLDGISIKEIQ